MSIVGVCEGCVQFLGFGWGARLSYRSDFWAQFMVCVKHSDYVVRCLVYFGWCDFRGVCEFCEVCGGVLLGRICVCVAKLVEVN